MKFKIIAALLILVLIHVNCISQNKKYTSIPAVYGKKYISTKVPEELMQRAVSVTNYLPDNYVNDGSVDYTSYLQRAFDDNDVIKIPKGAYSTTGLSLKSNKTLIFQDDSELRIIPSSRERYEVLAITGAENVSVYNARIKGDLRERKVLKGEWGFGIDIRGSKNINIYSPYITDCLGDGIVISRSSKGLKNNQTKLFDTANINISNAYIDYMGRNGISIIGVDGLKILSPIIANVFKRSPMSAIDIEPDNSSYELNNILIESPFTFNNVDGIMINFRNFVSSKSKTSNIVINNHMDVESIYPLNVPSLRQNVSHRALGGKVIVKDPVWISSERSIVRGEAHNLSPKIEIINPKLEGMRLKSWKGKGVTNATEKEKLMLHVKDKSNFIIK